MGRKGGSSYKQAKETDKDSKNRMRLDIEGTQVRETNRTKGKTNQHFYLLLVQFSTGWHKMYSKDTCVSARPFVYTTTSRLRAAFEYWNWTHERCVSFSHGNDDPKLKWETGKELFLKADGANHYAITIIFLMWWKKIRPSFWSHSEAGYSGWWSCAPWSSSTSISSLSYPE